MSRSLDAIKRVIAAFEQSDWTEIDVRTGDVRVHLATGAPTDPTPASSPPPPPAAPSTPPTTGRPPTERATTERATTGDPAPPTGDGGRSASAASKVPAGAHVVVAPSPGVFWRSPEPGAPPFVDVGHTVDAAATVCIVEVMKLMNHVKAGVRGEVAAVYADDGAAVGKGQVLFAITPADPSTASPGSSP